MKYSSIALLAILFLFSETFAQNADINIVPQPKSLKRLTGDFKLNDKTKIVATDETSRKSAAILNDLLMKNYGFKLESIANGNLPKKNFIKISTVQNPANNEAYNLKTSSNEIEISGSDIGQFYALQSLMQLLPVQFKGTAKIPAVEIADEPRFKYRGMMMDVGRHFMPVSFVKKFIDLMAQYKFNQFHWHLTEDQGWRIEIKKYPRLTEIGSKRKESTKDRNTSPYIGDGIPYGGFYTQEEIKDVVAYAKSRYVNVIPEIELPGHSVAALAAYPELGCKENTTYEVHTNWGITKDIYCPKEATFKFLEDVLTEVIALFPESPYIHIGGDEAPKDVWKASPFVQAMKRRENLKDEHEVQSYFIRRIEKFINSKGKKIIGWDEILEGGIAPNATIMSWRKETGGIEAAKAKHDVIMTPTTYLYFDYSQGNLKYEPISGNHFIPLERVYSYNPIPAELSADEAKYILGAQGNLWTEYIKTPENLEYKAFPRMLALSEVDWSPLESKNYPDFLRRMPYHYQLLDKVDVNYRIPEPEGLQNIILKDSDKAKIDLKPRILNAKIFYTLDGSNPTEQSKRYEKPFDVSLKQGELIELKLIVVNEKGRASSIYTSAISNREMTKPVELNQSAKGLNFKLFKGNFKSVKDFDTATPVETGTTDSTSLNQFSAKTNKFADAFGVQFDGYLLVPNDEIYEFEIDAKDGMSLQIDGETVLEADGQRARQIKTAFVPLAKGYHKISLRNFQTGGSDSFLNLRWFVKGSSIPRYTDSGFFH